MNRPAHVLEVCVDSVVSAIAAEVGGADRIELCSAISEGGLTPSLGLLRTVRARTRIGLHVLIRPRAGNFVYSDDEFEVIRRDIVLAVESGADGVVLGLLIPTAEVDVERTAELVALAHPMSVTFHRAIDVARDPVRAIKQISHTGADHVLTSGAQANALQGTGMIRELIGAATGTLTVMVGGGVRPENVAEIAAATGAVEWHSSLRSPPAAAPAGFEDKHRHLLQFGEQPEDAGILAGEVRRMRAALSKLPR